ncbi:IQ calmodulin-binding motif [Fusarium sp. NRRL 52700]|nr:IQ calmodulin-binding motif [Fusarium sp. NRRL 52700]
MVSQHVYDLCQVKETVSSVLANDPSQTPGNAIKKLYGHHEHALHHKISAKESTEKSEDAIEAALKCGRWGPTTPSPLFLQAFADSLQCLDEDPMAGVVSPPLMGSHGTMPLTVIAPLADVMRHCSNLIVRAEKEVFFITCSWAPSVAQALIKESLIELSRRAGKTGRRVIAKIMYDKPGPSNAINPHQFIKPKSYTSKTIDLPSPEEIPNVDLEVVSLHRIFLGTLHAKFCVVDRKIAAVMSNNTEDNDNLEMMVHVEGPIVDSIYDTALITWQNALHPEPPSLQTPATEGGSHTSTNSSTTTENQASHLRDFTTIQADNGEPLPEHFPDRPHYDDDIEGEVRRMQSCYALKQGESRLQAANRQLNLAVEHPIEPTGPEIDAGDEMTPYISTIGDGKPVPMALVSRPPYGAIDSKSVHVPQNEAWLSLIRNAKHNIFIQTPDLNAAPLIPALKEALKRGVEVTYYVCFGYNDPGEMIPGQGGTNDQIAQNLVSSLTKDSPERKLLHIYNYVGKDQDHPIHHSFKARSCHIKLLIVDGSVGIQGSGNQDTQSWFHSQEINLMVDSVAILDIQSLPSEVLSSILFFVRNERNGQDSIKECRLVSHGFNNAASPLLLTQVSVCLTSKSFTRLEYICNHPIFSKSVQCVSIVTSYYEAELACNRPLFMLEAKARLLRHVETMERSRFYRNKYPHTQEQSRWLSNMAWRTGPEFEQLFNNQVDEESPTPTQKLFLKLYDLYKELYNDQQQLREGKRHITRICAALSSLSNLVFLELNDVRNMGGMEHLDAADFAHTGYEDTLLQHFSPILRKSRWCGSFETIHTATPPVEMIGTLCSELADKGLRPRMIRLRLVPPPSMQAWQLSPSQQTGLQNLVSQTTKLALYVDFQARSYELKDNPRHEMLALCSITQSCLSAPDLEDIHVEFIGYPPFNRRPTVSLDDTMPVNISWPRLQSLSLHNQPFTVMELKSLVTRHSETLRDLDLQGCWLVEGSWADVKEFIQEQQNLDKSSIKYPAGGNQD